MGGFVAEAIGDPRVVLDVGEQDRQVEGAETLEFPGFESEYGLCDR